MTADQFRAALAACDWSAGYVAERLGVSVRLVHRWLSGAAAVPDRVAPWLEGHAAYQRGHWLPVGWTEEKPPVATRDGDGD